MGPSLCPSSVAVLSNAAYEHHHSRSTDDEEEEDEFEFRPLLPQPRRRCARTERPRIICRHVAVHACKVVASQPPSSQSARRAAAVKPGQAPPHPRRVRWHHMAFGSVRVPSAMDMGEIRRRLEARQANEPSAAAAADGWAPWRLIRSLSCKGVEAVAAAAPVRLV
jgi:hypothetical protein